MKTVTAAKRKAESKPAMPKGAAVFFVIVGLLMGTVFTVLTPYSYRQIGRDEAVYMEGTLEGMEFTYNHYRNYSKNPKIQGVNMDFSDIGRKFIRQCVTEELLERLNTLNPGDTLELYLRPNSSDILGIDFNGEAILDFDEAQNLIGRNVTGFIGLGIFCYLLAGFGAAGLLLGDRA